LLVFNFSDDRHTFSKRLAKKVGTMNMDAGSLYPSRQVGTCG